MTKQDRLAKANNLISVIASCGRRFLQYDGVVGRLELSPSGHIWYVDPYKGKRIYTHYNGAWREFSEGGTMRSLIIALRNYVRNGSALNSQLGPWPQWYFKGDPWSYGPDMDAVRKEAAILESNT